MSLFPFCSAWMGHHYKEAAPTATYGLVLLLAAFAYHVLQRTIVAQHKKTESRLAAALGKDWKGKLSPAVYLAAIPLAFVHPYISDALYLGVALLWIVPDRRIERTFDE